LQLCPGSRQKLGFPVSLRQLAFAAAMRLVRVAARILFISAKLNSRFFLDSISRCWDKLSARFDFSLCISLLLLKSAFLKPGKDGQFL
jgi:hypothetical protein